MDDQERSVHAHPLEVVSLALGVILLVTGLVFAIGDVDISRVSLGWVAFGVLVAAGLLTLGAAVRRHRAASGDAYDERSG